MKISAFTYGLLLSLLPSAWATLTTTSLLEACLTEYCTTSAASVPTQTTTYTLSEVGTVLSYPQTTITPKASTATVKSTTIVTATKTSGTVATFISTSTVIATTSVTVTAVVTVPIIATVSVTVTPTYTVPTPAGFTPEADSAYTKRKRDVLAHPHTKRAVSSSSSVSPTATHYPQAVTCGLLVDIYGVATKTASSTSTITAPASTLKVTSTITGTVTSTICHASVTQTSTTTLAVTATFTSTISTYTDTDPAITVTETAATTTVYAACATDNLYTYDSSYSPPGGYVASGIGNDYGTSDNFATVPTDSSYDCCVACQTNGDCGGAVYDASVGLCYIDEPSGTCDPDDPTFSYYAGSSTFQGVTLIAGPCGQPAGT